MNFKDTNPAAWLANSEPEDFPEKNTLEIQNQQIEVGLFPGMSRATKLTVKSSGPEEQTFLG